MFNDEMDVGFSFDAGFGDRTKYFNIDGSMAQHVNVWVEALDDQRFWMGYLKGNDFYKFSFKQPIDIESLKGTSAGGCERLFYFEKKGIIKLGVTEIFCLDSDDSFVKSFCSQFTSPKAARPFVYSTNIYAIENAFLSGDLIDRTFEAIVARPVEGEVVLPSTFVSEVSKLLFSLMKKLAFYEVVSKDCKDATRARVSLRLLVRSLKRVNCAAGLAKCTFFSGFVSAVQSLESEVNDALKMLNLTASYEEFEVKVESSGVCSENAFLFYRGHSIFDAVIKAYAVLSDSHREVEVDRVQAAFKNSGAQAIADQVSGVNKSWVEFGNTLKHNFYACRPPVPFLSEASARLTIDYKQVV